MLWQTMQRGLIQEHHQSFTAMGHTSHSMQMSTPLNHCHMSAFLMDMEVEELSYSICETVPQPLASILYVVTFQKVQCRTLIPCFSFFNFSITEFQCTPLKALKLQRLHCHEWVS